MADEEFQPLVGEVEPFNIPAVYRNYPGRPWNPIFGTSTNPPMVPPVATAPPIVVGGTGAPPPANPPFPPNLRPPILPPTTGPSLMELAEAPPEFSRRDVQDYGGEGGEPGGPVRRTAGPADHEERRHAAKPSAKKSAQTKREKEAERERAKAERSEENE